MIKNIHLIAFIIESITKYRVFLIMIIIFSISLYSEESNYIIITDIYSSTKVKDEWKYPGQYSPANLFDNNTTTCYAVENDFKNSERTRISAIIKFKHPVLMDEIRIVNGNAGNEVLYNKNSRVRSLSLYLYSEKEINKYEYLEESVVLKDTIEIQNLNLSRTYKVKEIQFGASNWQEKNHGVYQGSMFNDICLSEMAFYYKGKKINIENNDKLKKDYIRKLNDKLVDNFSDKNCYWDSSNINTTSYKDGRFKVTTGFGNTPDYIPDRWKVNESKLYLRVKKKWILFEYWLGAPDRKTVILYDPDYNGDPCCNGILVVLQPEIKN